MTTLSAVYEGKKKHQCLNLAPTTIRTTLDERTQRHDPNHRHRESQQTPSQPPDRLAPIRREHDRASRNDHPESNEAEKRTDVETGVVWII